MNVEKPVCCYELRNVYKFLWMIEILLYQKWHLLRHITKPFVWVRNEREASHYPLSSGLYFIVARVSFFILQSLFAALAEESIYSESQCFLSLGVEFCFITHHSFYLSTWIKCIYLFLLHKHIVKIQFSCWLWHFLL